MVFPFVKLELTSSEIIWIYVCRKPNIFDNMMAMMEKYANNLEVLVDERTDQLVEEKKKTGKNYEIFYFYSLIRTK